MTKKLKHISMLALLAVAVQGAWGQTTFELGRPLYRDGDWNTLCLPFSMTKTQIDNSPLAGTIIKELDGTNSSLHNGTLTLTFKDASTIVGDETYTIVAGKPYIVKWPADLIIDSQSKWDTFLTNVSAGTSYEGKIVKLYTDLETTEMVPGSFNGIFDGGGHTIHCTINNSYGDNDQGTALFTRIYNATIMNLKVTGTVQGNNHCAGLVGLATAGGTNIIKNCEVATQVFCNQNHCGGILGHGTTSTTTISNCLFSGSLTGITSQTGIIYGWGDSGGNHCIDHSLANGDYSDVNLIDMIYGAGTISVEACYKNTGSGNYGQELDVYFGNEAYATSTYVSNLGTTDWKMVEFKDENENTKYKAVPKMNAYVEKTSPISNPEFENEPTTNTTTDIPFTGGTFKGKFAELDIDDSNRNEILLFAAGNKLGYANTNRTLKAYSAYFEIPTTKGAQAVRSFVLDFGDEDSTLGIMDAEADSSLFTHHSSLSEWYTLDGRRLDGKPTTKGIYVNNGKKVVIK